MHYKNKYYVLIINLKYMQFYFRGKADYMRFLNVIWKIRIH